MSELLIATHNTNKFKELESLLQSTGFNLISLADMGITEEIEEVGTTFEQNARLKAEGYLRLSGMPTLADDSGLEVEALNGEPGVYSARYGSPQASSDEDRVQLLLHNLDRSGNANRGAQFRCVIALAFPEHTIELYNGKCTGEIAEMPRGDNGFGYDPIFLVIGLKCTSAELEPQEKNRLSHRGQALRQLVEQLRQECLSRGQNTARRSTG